jgi:FkbM family methyltransferase
MRLTIDRRSGLYYRPDCNDKLIIAEIRGSYADLPIRRGDVFLDLGAHIGGASRAALDRGAKQAVAVEADPSSVIVLRRNLRGRPARIVWAAVTSAPERAIPFYTRPDRPHLSSARADDAGRQRVMVPTVSLGALLDTFRPTVVKCDIEFGEYELPELRALPPTVRVLALEVHVRHDLVFRSVPQSDADLLAQRAAAADLIAAVEAQGFVEVRRKNKQATTGEPVKDDTGLPPRCKSVDAIWERQ